MKRTASLAALALSGCFFPAPDATHLYACAANTDCPSGNCVAGLCTAGPAAADAGVCDGGEVLDEGVCYPGCSDGNCASGSICDTAANACVALQSCNTNAACDAGTCQDGICAGSGSTVLCPIPTDAGVSGVGMFPVNGTIHLFGSSGLSSGAVLIDGGLSFASGDSQMAAVLNVVSVLDNATDLTYTVQLPNAVAGHAATATLTGPGAVPTVFPDLMISGPGRLDLLAYAAVGVDPSDSHLIWFGTILACGDATTAVGDQTFAVALSPAPLDGILVQSPVMGAFQAPQGVRAATTYVVNIDASLSLTGMYTPPSGTGPLAVGLLYPNFPQ